MMFKTHLLFGLLVGLFALLLFNPASGALFILFVMVGSAFADVDHPDSKFGKRVPLIGLLFTHRGFFQSLFAIVLFTFLVQLIFRVQYLTIGFALGYLSHLVLDVLNHQGIMPFHPLSDFRVKGFIKSNGFVESILFVAFGAMIFVMLLI